MPAPPGCWSAWPAAPGTSSASWPSRSRWARAGLDVVYVGGDLPPDSWVVAATTQRPAAVVIGVPAAEDVPAVRDTVAALAAARPDLPVLLGGGHQERVKTGELLGHSLGDGGHLVGRPLTAFPA
jgi:hypothetical protein